MIKGSSLHKAARSIAHYRKQQVKTKHVVTTAAHRTVYQGQHEASQNSSSLVGKGNAIHVNSTLYQVKQGCTWQSTSYLKYVNGCTAL